MSLNLIAFTLQLPKIKREKIKQFTGIIAKQLLDKPDDHYYVRIN